MEASGSKTRGRVWLPQPGAEGNCIVYDPNAFNWAGDSLTPPTLNDLFIYELHMGTFYTNTPPPVRSGHQQVGLLEKPRRQCG